MQIFNHSAAFDADRQPRPTVLTVPGVDGSGPRHWQTYWERLSHFRRVEFPGPAEPRLHRWVPALRQAVEGAPGRVLFVAHSLGCLALAWWASLHRGSIEQARVVGALLVAPPDVDRLDTSVRIRDFRPTPQLKLPFPSILVASRSDPYAEFAASERMARLWGSEFVDLGEAGHINADSALGEWSQGLQFVARLSGQNAGLLAAELGLRTVLA